MKKIIVTFILISPLFLHAQIGIKAGVNFANISKASDINNSSRTGFHAGLFLALPSTGVLSSRTEILFSRQGYDYKTATKTGNINLDYILLPQLMSINITKYFSLQLGAQMAFLINAKVDSSSSSSGYGSSGNDITELYNKFDYGYAVGVEVHPVKGLLIAARYNVSLAKVYKDLQNSQRPSFTSEDAKNNVVMLSVGWRFGKTPEKPKAPKSNM